MDSVRDLAVVADGMGGHEAGEFASESVIDAMQELMGTAHSEAEILRILQQANERIFERMFSERGRPAMGSTVAGIVFRGDKAFAFNVGDSRIYTLGRGNLIQHSVDDTLDRVTPGVLRRSHALTQSLGGSLSRLPLNPHVKTINIANREQVLLCSDGLTDMLPDAEIAGVLLRQPSRPAEALVSAALDAGGKDNVTAVVIGVAERPAK